MYLFKKNNSLIIMNSRNYSQKYYLTFSKLKKINDSVSISFFINNNSTKKFQFKPHHKISNLTQSNKYKTTKKQTKDNSKLSLKINNKFNNSCQNFCKKQKNNINCYNSNNVSNILQKNNLNYKKVYPKRRSKHKNITKNDTSNINNIISKKLENYFSNINQVSFTKNNKKNNITDLYNYKKYHHSNYSSYCSTPNIIIEKRNKISSKSSINNTMNNIIIHNNNINIIAYNKYYDYLIDKINNLKKEVSKLKKEKNDLLNLINNTKVEQKKYDYVLNIKKEISYQRNIMQKIMQIHQNYKSEINNINIQLKV